jgi:hypothetical protein
MPTLGEVEWDGSDCLRVGTLEGRVRGDRDRALLTALLRADALSIGRVLQLPGLFRPPVRA